jgi:stage II sporulation protein D
LRSACRAGCVIILALAPAVARGTDVVSALNAGYNAYLLGHYDEAIGDFKYLDMLGVRVPDPVSNSALMARDAGRSEDAAAYWLKATLESRADGFVWTQRGWSLLAIDEPGEAQKAFRKGIEFARETSTQAEARLGLAMAQIEDGRPRWAYSHLNSAQTQSAYLLPIVYLEISRAASLMRDKERALNDLKAAAQLDPLDLEVVKTLSNFDYKIGLNESAWAMTNWYRSLDPASPWAVERVKKLRRRIAGDPDKQLPIRRLFRPFLAPAGRRGSSDGGKGPELRVALFSDRRGSPETATRIYFMPNADFKIVAVNNKETLTDAGRAYDQWELRFRPDTAVIEVRDGQGNIQYLARQPFRIVVKDSQGSILLKSGRFLESYGFDPGDRELRGEVEVIPVPSGFRMVNIAPLEEYLKGAVGAALPDKSPAAAYEAAAVVARTKALWLKSRGIPNMEHSDLCDSERCQRYLGVTSELLSATDGVRATAGQVLAMDGRVAHALWHQDCGGVTESGESDAEPSLHYLKSIEDAPRFKYPKTPMELERFLHGFPPADSYGLASGLNLPVQSRWTRILDAKELSERAARAKDIGSIRSLIVTSRSRTGRVLALNVVGSAGTIRLKGAAAVADFLSPGSLRSTWFSIQPIGPAKKPRSFILWGAGDGRGLGFCKAGALGLAALGRSHQEILAHYFPELTIQSFYQAPKPEQPKTAASKTAAQKGKAAPARRAARLSAGKAKTKRHLKYQLQRARKAKAAGSQ